MSWSAFLGGSAVSSAAAVALTPEGNILVSGISDVNFPSTPGPYHVADTQNRPYLLEIDATGTRLVFSATGIGGTSIALDNSGSVFLAGSTRRLDYPTTPGAYQEKFFNAVQWTYCLGPSCFGGFQGVNQYVTKVDSSGSTLLYSTALSNQKDFGGQIVNHGLAVDTDGNAYVTGLAWEGGDYPFTTSLPKGIAYPSFLTKLDAAGKNVIFSVPLGGAGISIRPSGELYIGGSYNNFNARQYLNLGPAPLQSEDPPSGISGLPAACRVNNVTSAYQAYTSKVDPNTGTALATRIIDSSNLTNLSMAVSGNLMRRERWAICESGVRQAHCSPCSPPSGTQGQFNKHLLHFACSMFKAAAPYIREKIPAFTGQTRYWRIQALGTLGGAADVPLIASYLNDPMSDMAVTEAIQELTGVNFGARKPGLVGYPSPETLAARAWWRSHKNEWSH